MKRASKIVSCTLMLGATALTSWAFVPPPEPAWSQDAPEAPAAPESEAQELKRKVAWLEKRYRELARRVGEDGPVAPKPPKPAKPPRAPRPTRSAPAPKPPKPPQAPAGAHAPMPHRSGSASMASAITLILSEKHSAQRRRAAFEKLLASWSSGRLEKDGRAICWGSALSQGAHDIELINGAGSAALIKTSRMVRPSWPLELRTESSFFLIREEDRSPRFEVRKLEESHMKLIVRERFVGLNAVEAGERLDGERGRVYFIVSGPIIRQASAR